MECYGWFALDGVVGVEKEHTLVSVIRSGNNELMSGFASRQCNAAIRNCL
jgi:hypothetical protein